MYKFVYGFLLVIVLGSSGCSDWLDVQPKTSVPEEDLFADEFGFQDALDVGMCQFIYYNQFGM